MRNQKYWIAVVSKEHTQWGVDGGYIQVCHGKQAPLKRMKRGDWIIVYSPKVAMEGDKKSQSFTAIGQARDEEVYPYKMSENFVPFRRNIEFYKCEETSIIPLISNLEFIPNKKSWGFPFRYGFFEINENDFNLILSKMAVNER